MCYPPPQKKNKLVLFSHLAKLTSKLVLSLVSTLERVYLLKLPTACIISLAHWVSLHLWKFIVKQGLFKYPFPAHPFVDNGLMACFKCIFTIQLCCSTKICKASLNTLHSKIWNMMQCSDKARKRTTTTIFALVKWALCKPTSYDLSLQVISKLLFTRHNTISYLSPDSHMKCVDYSEKVSDKENTEKFVSNRPRLDTEHNISPHINLVWIKKFLCRIKTMSADESWSVEHPFQNSYQREREALYCFWLPKRKNQIWCTGPLYASQAKLFMDHKTDKNKIWFLL